MKDISEEEVKSLTTAIKNRYDLDFTCYEIGSLKRRVSRALAIFKLDSTHALWAQVLREDGFIHKLVNELSVGLTSMFRDPQLWSRLKQLLPDLVAEKGKLRVWHAGCSTGEEIFTFNIILKELGLLDKVESVATDINSDSLKRAREGTYSLAVMKDYEKNYKEYNPVGSLSQHYSIITGAAVMDEKLIKNVTFKQNNLITEEPPAKFDIIFCRNVMIYFDRIAKLKVLDKFYGALNNKSLLVVGYFDSLVTVIDKSDFQFFELEHKIFRKLISLSPEETQDVNKEILRLLDYIAHIDGEYDKNERVFAEKIRKRKNLNEEPLSFEKGFSLKNLKQPDNKSELIFLALQMMKADGKIRTKEIAFCKSLSNHLGYHEDLVRDLAFSELPSERNFEREIKKYIKQP